MSDFAKFIFEHYYAKETMHRMYLAGLIPSSPYILGDIIKEVRFYDKDKDKVKIKVKKCFM